MPRLVSNVPSAFGAVTTGVGWQRIDGAPRRGIDAGVAVEAAHREAALVVVIVAAEDEVDAVAIEERQPRCADARSEPLPSSTNERVLVHLHDDPVDAVVLRASRSVFSSQRVCSPPL